METCGSAAHVIVFIIHTSSRLDSESFCPGPYGLVSVDYNIFKVSDFHSEDPRAEPALDRSVRERHQLLILVKPLSAV